MKVTCVQSHFPRDIQGSIPSGATCRLLLTGKPMSGSQESLGGGRGVGEDSDKQRATMLDVKGHHPQQPVLGNSGFCGEGTEGW